MTTEEACIWGPFSSPLPNILVMLLILSHLVTNPHTQHGGGDAGRAEPSLGQEFVGFEAHSVADTADARLAANPVSLPTEPHSRSTGNMPFPQEVNPDWLNQLEYFHSLY